jgi:flagellar basal body rod protein FlgG
MLNGIVNTARTLSFHLRKQEVTANNLANVDTDAFKADRIAAHASPGAGFPVPAQQIDLQQGRFRETGRPLDVAVDGPGFLVVRTPEGERLTRGGSLRLDPAGRLADMHGNLVMGEGGPLVLVGADIEIRSDGTVLVDGGDAGRLRMETVDDPSALRKEGMGRFIAAGPTVAVDEGAAALRQGAVEEPNLDPLLSMVDLIAIQRAYAANADALKSMDGMLGLITGEVGKV